jgi:hypothetical protein
MRYKLMCVCAVLAMAAAPASAQTKHTFSGKCSKPDVLQTVPAADKDGHAFMLEKGTCDATTGEVEGAKSKQGAFVEHGEVSGTHTQAWGVYVETFDNGDKIFYDYHTYGKTKDGAFASGENRYHITGGTGKMKGIKGSGSCKLTGNSGGGLDYACTGEYTISAAKASAKK